MILAGAVLVLAVALLAPARLPPLPPPSAARAPQPDVHAGVATVPDRSPPPVVAEVAGLFVPARAARPLPVAVPRPPQQAPWLHYVAFAVNAGGETVYFFKDDQSGRVLMLSLSRTAGDWRLLSADKGGYLLEKGGQQFLVPAVKP